MNNTLLIFAPKEICIQKVNEYEMNISNTELRSAEIIGYAAWSPILDRKVMVNYTDVDYKYKPEDFKEYEDAEWHVWSKHRNKVAWIKEATYF